MTTRAEIPEAERRARERRLANVRTLLQVDETKATAAEKKLVQRVKAAADGDGVELDKALAGANVGKLFAKGILHFSPPATASQKEAAE